MGDLLGKLDREKYVNLKNIKIDSKESNLKNIIDCFESLNKQDHYYSTSYDKDIFSNVQLLKIKSDYSAEDITKFCIYLVKYQNRVHFDDYVGDFLSALINFCDEDNITIDTTNLDILINNFGKLNTKNITVIGSLGSYVGKDMTSGSIKIIGNATHSLGTNMRDGFIIVNGNVTNYLGGRMCGGSIQVLGNVGRYIGVKMSGGSIQIKGNVETNLGAGMIGGSIIVDGHAGHLIGYNIPKYYEDDSPKESVISLNGSYHSIWVCAESKNFNTECFANNCKIYHKDNLIVDCGYPLNLNDHYYLEGVQLIVPKKTI